MIDYRNIIKSRELRLKIIPLLRFIPDKPYLKMVYWIKTGGHLNLSNPITFCDKQNWLKLHEKKAEYSKLADKYLVRDVIRNKLGNGYSFPLVGKWDNADQIDFDKLPNKFVLKCNHDSGSVRVVRDKKSLSPEDIRAIRVFLNNRLKRNDFADGREYPYKGIKPCVIAEDLMLDSEGNLPKDYKFFCFDGTPQILFVATDREHDTKFDFYDMNWQHLDIVNIHPQSGLKITKPICFEEMKQVVSKLSEGMKFVRIDLYELDGKIYFGEYTFFHGGGFWPMKPVEWEYTLGNMIVIDDLVTKRGGGYFTLIAFMSIGHDVLTTFKEVAA